MLHYQSFFLYLSFPLPRSVFFFHPVFTSGNSYSSFRNPLHVIISGPEPYLGYHHLHSRGKGVRSSYCQGIRNTCHFLIRAYFIDILYLFPPLVGKLLQGRIHSCLYFLAIPVSVLCLEQNRPLKNALPHCYPQDLRYQI